MKLDQTFIGNILFGLAMAFLVDNVALDGAVTKTLPADFVFLIAFVIFVGVAYYAFKQAKKLN